MTDIKTERLKITPLSLYELNLLVNQYKNTVPELSEAYREMLDNCISYPEQHVWYTAWEICLIDNGENVGFLGFKGFNHGYPEIGYGINDGFQGNGYATEAVGAICSWAFKMPCVAAIEAETEITNIGSVKVLTKNGFIRNGVIGKEGPRFILKPY